MKGPANRSHPISCYEHNSLSFFSRGLLARVLSLFHSRLLSLFRSLSLSFPLFLFFHFSPSLSLSFFFLSLPLPLSLSLFISLSHFLSLTHTHTVSLSLSLPFSLFQHTEKYQSAFFLYSNSNQYVVTFSGCIHM